MKSYTKFLISSAITYVVMALIYYLPQFSLFPSHGYLQLAFDGYGPLFVMLGVAITGLILYLLPGKEGNESNIPAFIPFAVFMFYGLPAVYFASFSPYIIAALISVAFAVCFLFAYGKSKEVSYENYTDESGDEDNPSNFYLTYAMTSLFIMPALFYSGASLKFSGVWALGFMVLIIFKLLKGKIFNHKETGDSILAFGLNLVNFGIVLVAFLITNINANPFNLKFDTSYLYLFMLIATAASLIVSGFRLHYEFVKDAKCIDGIKGFDQIEQYPPPKDTHSNQEILAQTSSP